MYYEAAAHVPAAVPGHAGNDLIIIPAVKEPPPPDTCRTCKNCQLHHRHQCDHCKDNDRCCSHTVFDQYTASKYKPTAACCLPKPPAPFPQIS